MMKGKSKDEEDICSFLWRYVEAANIQSIKHDVCKICIQTIAY